MDALQNIQAPIIADLDCYREQFKATLQHDNALLNIALNHLVKSSGKLMRPTLVLLAAKTVGNVNQKVMDVALALELLHTASLVHDDVVDESDRRRGQASVNALMTNQIAVLVGDFILSKALQHAANTGDASIVSVIAKLGQTLADGELLQLSNIDSDKIDETSYYEVIRKKTASLFATCAQLGVLAAGGTAEEAEKMRQFGQLVGSCFQLRDDIFDYESNTDVGKPAGNDMKEGKLTLPVIHAVNKGKDPAMRDLALRVRAGSASQQDIDTLVDYTFKQDGIAYAEWAMDELRMMASGLISDQCNVEVAKALHAFVDYVAKRNK